LGARKVHVGGGSNVEGRHIRMTPKVLIFLGFPICIWVKMVLQVVLLFIVDI